MLHVHGSSVEWMMNLWNLVLCHTAVPFYTFLENILQHCSTSEIGPIATLVDHGEASWVGHVTIGLQ